MERKRLERFAPLTGLVFLVLAVVSFALGGDSPDADAPTAEVVEFWTDEDTRNVASAIVATYAALFFVWFAGSVRAAIARAEPGASRLAALAFGGAVIFAAGLALNNAFQMVAADTAGDVPPEVTQTLHVLFDGGWVPLALGFAVFLLSSGLGALRHGAFDRRLGWIALGLGVLAVTPLGFFAFLAGLVWTGLAGVVLYRQQDPATGGGAAPPAPGSGGEPPPLAQQPG